MEILRTKVIILIYFLAFLSHSKAVEISININGIEQHIPFQTINSTNYIEIQHLALILNKNAISETTIIDVKKEKLKFAAGSFFVVYEKDEKLRVAQMSLPCIEKSTQIIIPWEAFLNSMQGINLLSYNIKFGKYTIKTELFSPKTVKPKSMVIIKDVAKPDSTLIKNKTNVKRVEAEIKKQYNKDSLVNHQSNIIDTITSPQKYIIPKGLVK